MKYLNLFEKHQSESEVAEICRKYGIINWTLNSDGLVDVFNNSVKLNYKGLTKLPLEFGEINRYFDCDRNELTSLEGAPKKVYSDFYCSHNNLTSLEFAPIFVNGDFHCLNNKIRSFEGLVDIGGNFYCIGNPLEKVWDLINPGTTIESCKWDSEKMDFFNDLDIIRGDEIAIERLNFFLEEMGLETVESVEGYKNIY